MRLLESYNQFLKLNESGIRDIKKISKTFDEAEIYFHVDLDGVTSAIAMREYLKQYGIKTVRYHTIQYGGMEYHLDKPQPGTLAVLVDFAHGKTEFVIHTDHHDMQIGVETMSAHFKKAKSNAGTISGEISPNDIFSAEDVNMIDTVDSADYASQDITPSDVIQFFYKTNKDISTKSNRMKLGFVVNKLLLAYKNKPGFLVGLVENSKPSLVSMFLEIKKLAKDLGLDPAESIEKHANTYFDNLKNFKKLVVKNDIMMQYGGPRMFDTGSYDRYASFKLYPDANFFIMAWPMGLVQVSTNPFKKKDPKFEHINLGDIAQDVLNNFKTNLQNVKITVKNIKRISEQDMVRAAKGTRNKAPKDISNEFGFRFKDLVSLFKDQIVGLDQQSENVLDAVMTVPFIKLSENDKKILNDMYVTAWDIIQSNSGGHKFITNVSGLNYLNGKRVPDPDNEKTGMQGMGTYYLKKIARDFYFKLTELQNRKS